MPFVAGQKVRASELEAMRVVTNEPDRIAQYNQSGNQTVAAGDQILAFGTQNVVSPLVTRFASGSYHYFRVLRSGVWLAETTIRRFGGGGFYCAIVAGGAIQASGAEAQTVTICVPVRVNAGTDFDVRVWSAGGMTTEANNPSAWGRLNLMWLCP